MGLLDPTLLGNLNKLKGLLGETPIGKYVRGQDQGVSVNGLKQALLGMPVFDQRAGEQDMAYAADAIGPQAIAGGGILGIIKKAGSPSAYQGGHKPPGVDAAPLHDLTGGGRIYPDDVYTHGAQYYGTPDESGLFYMANKMRGRPNAQVTIYRAVPYEKTPSEMISELEKQRALYLKRGIMPAEELSTAAERRAGFNANQEKWYDKVSREIEELKAMPVKEPEVFDINPGDWVALDRKYAKQHGESALGGKYKIVSKKVKAKDLFTNGDSIQEWGWWPNK